MQYVSIGDTAELAPGQMKGSEVDGHEVRWLNIRRRQDTAASGTLAASLCRLARALGPYLAIELLLPGGSVIALLLWLHRLNYRSADPVPETTSRVALLGMRLPATLVTEIEISMLADAE